VAGHVVFKPVRWVNGIPARGRSMSSVISSVAAGHLSKPC
jgi:hypothetical protein